MLNKICSFVLSFCIILGSISVPVYGNIDNTIERTETARDEIVNQLGTLSSANGTTSNEVLLKLEELGLLDGTGDLVSSQITIEGETKSLAEVKNLFISPDVDLGKTVLVNGIPLTMGELKTIIAIEDELASVESEFFNPNVDITDTHQEALKILAEQLSTTGMVINPSDAVEIQDAAGIDRDVRVLIEQTDPSSNLEHHFTATLVKVDESNNVLKDENDKLIVPTIDYDISFQYALVDGSYDVNNDNKYETVTLNKERITKDITIDFFNQQDHDWTGNRYYYLRCISDDKSLFVLQSEKKSKRVLTKRISVESKDYSDIYRSVENIVPLHLNRIHPAWSKVDDHLNNFATEFNYKLTDQNNSNEYKNKMRCWVNGNSATYLTKPIEITDNFRTLYKKGIITHITKPEMWTWDDGEAILKLMAFNSKGEEIVHKSICIIGQEPQEIKYCNEQTQSYLDDISIKTITGFGEVSIDDVAYIGYGLELLGSHVNGKMEIVGSPYASLRFVARGQETKATGHYHLYDSKVMYDYYNDWRNIYAWTIRGWDFQEAVSNGANQDVGSFRFQDKDGDNVPMLTCPIYIDDCNKKLIEDGIITHFVKPSIWTWDDGEVEVHGGVSRQYEFNNDKYEFIVDSYKAADDSSKEFIKMNSDLKNNLLDKYKHYYRFWLNIKNDPNGNDSQEISGHIDKALQQADATTPSALKIELNKRGKMNDLTDSYTQGEILPVVLTYNEPVKNTRLKGTLEGDNKNMPFEEKEAGNSEDLSHKKVYEIQVKDYLSKMTAVKAKGKDINDQGGDWNSVSSNNSITLYQGLEDAFKKNEIKVMNKDENQNLSENEFKLVLPLTDPDGPNKYVVSKILGKASENQNTADIYNIKAKVFASDNNGKETAQYIQLKVDDLSDPTALIGEFRAPVNTEEVDKKYRVALYKNETIEYSDANVLKQQDGDELLFDIAPTYIVKKAVFIEDFDIDTSSISFKENSNNKIVELSNEAIKNSAIEINNINNNGFYTFDEFLVESSNSEVAEISKSESTDDTNKEIYTVKWKKPGEVYFKVTALNGDVENKKLVKRTSVITVERGIEKVITVVNTQKEMNAHGMYLITQGENATIEWTSNIEEFYEADQEIELEIKVYEAIYEETGAVSHNETALKTETIKSSGNNKVTAMTIDTELVNKVTSPNQVGYIVEITADGVMATSYIQVKSKSAIVTLDKLEKYYITDEMSSIDIKYNVENFDEFGEFRFKVTKNEEEEPVIDTTELKESEVLTINKVAEGLKDIYTVTVTAKNPLDRGAVYDSFMLYVYNSEALKIQINGENAPDHVIYNNNERIKNMSSQERLDLKRQIYLGDMISANGSDYDWSAYGDMMKWQSSDNNVATINKNVFGTYYDIENLDYPLYTPDTEFMLSAINNGNTSVTSTHGLSGMKDALDIDVITLEDKLYLINVYPKTKTAVKYTNGDGVEVNTITNEKGEIAIYEPKGIQSHVYFKSEYENNTYLGTMYHENLKTKEQDRSQEQLYPLNVIELLPVTEPKMTLLLPDAKGYTGTAKLKGGVYKNDKYCPEARLNLIDGKVSQNIDVKNGIFEVQLDSMQFYTDVKEKESLKVDDNLEFVFEIIVDKYEPILIYVDGNTSFEDVKIMYQNTHRLKATDNSDIQSPIINQNMITMKNGIKKKVNKSITTIGPNKTSEEVVLTTQLLCPKKDSGHQYKATIQDQFKYVPSAQKSQLIEYPFTTYDVMENTLTLNEKTLWMGDRKSRNIELKITDHAKDVKTIPYDFKVVNMSGFDVNLNYEFKTLHTRLAEDVIGGAIGELGNVPGVDGVLSVALDILGGTQNVGATKCRMIFAPTEDPTVFNAIIDVNLGYSDLRTIPDSENGGIYQTGALDGEFKWNIMGNMAKYKFRKKALQENIDNIGKKKVASLDYMLRGGGYYKGKIKVDMEDISVKFIPDNYSFFAKAGIGTSVFMNAQVGPVPVTTEYTVRGTLEYTQAAANKYGIVVEDLYGEDSVTDYLKTLRFELYIYAFGGVGVDYGAVALKIGVFGELEAAFENRWLTRPYLLDANNKLYVTDSENDNKKILHGNEIRVEGRVGLEIVAKCFTFSYRKILASAGFKNAKHGGDWDYIDTYWKENKNGGIYNDRSILAGNNDQAVSCVHEELVVEDRDYLNAYSREWNGDSKNGVIPANNMTILASNEDMPVVAASASGNIMRNAYPYATPQFTGDSNLMVYISDEGEADKPISKVYYSLGDGYSYNEGQAISNDYVSYGDNYLDVDGNSDYAVAAWSSQTADLDKEPGESIGHEEIARMSNSSEIMASIFNGTSWSTPVKLSDNTIVDITPVVMTDGDRTIVAWRQGYASDINKPLEFGANDSIVYKIYENGSWSEEKTLYSGTLGNIKALDGDMLTTGEEKGTASVVYEVEIPKTNLQDPANYTEIIYSVIDKDDEVSHVKVTNNTIVDENPKMVTHTFEDGEERFVLAWYSVDGKSDINLNAYNSRGQTYPKFTGSLKEILGSAGVNITTNFKFAKKGSDDPLAFTWKEPVVENGGTDSAVTKDVLRGVKLLQDDTGYYLSAPVPLATMDEATVIDHFDATVDDSGNIVALLLNSDYDKEVYKEYKTAEDETVVTVVSESKIDLVRGIFDNNFEIRNIDYELASVIPGMELPISLQLYNNGIDTIDSVSVYINGEKLDIIGDDQMSILSGRNKTISALYTVPSKVEDIKCKIYAKFENGDTRIEEQSMQMVYPGVGISTFDVVKEGETLRHNTYSIYNDTRIDLEEGRHQVVVEFYNKSDEEEKVLKKLILDDKEELEHINEGIYSNNITFDINDFVDNGQEIPDSGIIIGCKVWVEDTINGSHTELPELNEDNNKKVIVYNSLIAKHDMEKVTVKTAQKVENGQTIVEVSVQNNSLVDETSGNVIVTIYDKYGNKLGQQETYNSSASDKGIIKLGAEGESKKMFAFNTYAATNKVTYSDVILDINNADLGSLALKGYPIYFNQDETTYNIESDYKINQKLSFTTAHPDATVTVNGVPNNTGEVTVNLSEETKTYNIVVTAVNGNNKTYSVTVAAGSEEDNQPDNPEQDQKPTGGGTGTSSHKKTGKYSLKEQGYKLSKKAFKALIDAGEDIVLEGDGYTLTFDSDQQFVLDNLEYDFKLSHTSPNAKEIQNIIHDKDAVDLYFAFHGKLPGNAKVQVTVGEAYKGKKKYLYYYNSEKAIVELYGLIQIDSQGVATFEIDHCSDYILSTKFILSKGLIDENIEHTPIVKGYSDNTIKPNAFITRAEVATVMDNILADVDVKDASFSDCDMWAKDSILQLKALGIINGYQDNTFRPNQYITREEFVTIVANMVEGDEIQSYKLCDFNDISNSWAKENIALCYELNLVNGYDGKFNPKNNITRAEVITIVNRILSRELDTTNQETLNFIDIDESHWAYDEVRKAVNIR